MILALPLILISCFFVVSTRDLAQILKVETDSVEKLTQHHLPTSLTHSPLLHKGNFSGRGTCLPVADSVGGEKHPWLTEQTLLVSPFPPLCLSCHAAEMHRAWQHSCDYKRKTKRTTETQTVTWKFWTIVSSCLLPDSFFIEKKKILNLFKKC